MKKDWKTDWEVFVRSVAADFRKGLSNTELSDKYAGQLVNWTGTIGEKTLEGDSPEIQLNMPPVQIEGPNGIGSIVDYLMVNLTDTDVKSWRKSKIGDKVKFRTKIISGIGPFPGIRWLATGQEGLLMFATDGGFRIGDEK